MILRWGYPSPPSFLRSQGWSKTPTLLLAWPKMEDDVDAEHLELRPDPAPVAADDRLAHLALATRKGQLHVYAYLKASRLLVLVFGHPPFKVAAVFNMWEMRPMNKAGNPTHVISIREHHLPFIWHTNKSFPFRCMTIDEYCMGWADFVPRMFKQRAIGENNETCKLLDQFQCGELPLPLQKELHDYQVAVQKGEIDVMADVASLELQEPQPHILEDHAAAITLGFCTRKGIENYGRIYRVLMERVASKRALLRSVFGWHGQRVKIPVLNIREF